MLRIEKIAPHRQMRKQMHPEYGPTRVMRPTRCRGDIVQHPPARLTLPARACAALQPSTAASTTRTDGRTHRILAEEPRTPRSRERAAAHDSSATTRHASSLRRASAGASLRHPPATAANIEIPARRQASARMPPGTCMRMIANHSVWSPGNIRGDVWAPRLAPAGANASRSATRPASQRPRHRHERSHGPPSIRRGSNSPPSPHQRRRIARTISGNAILRSPRGALRRDASVSRRGLEQLPIAPSGERQQR